MKRTYTFFVATPELLTCPEIFEHARAHHIILHPAEARTLNIVSPLEHPLGDVRKATVSYDPAILDVELVHLAAEANLLYLTITLRATDIGETEISLTLPEAEPGLLASPTTHYLLTD
jgi:hypothetical protein